MAPTREIIYPLKLSTAQLAYLLGVIQATTLIGGDDDALFPSAPAAQETLWKQGIAQLMADGWLVVGDEGHLRLNEQLVLITAGLANPDLALLTVWETPDRQEHGVCHYLSPGLVIEMSIVDGLYHVLVLDSQATMLARLARTAGMPEAKHQDLSFVIARSDVELAKRAPDPAWLAAHGLSPRAAQIFAATLRQPSCYGLVTLLRVVLGKPTALRLAGFVASSEGIGWIGVPLEDNRLRYTLSDSHDFESMLSAQLTELRATNGTQAYSQAGI